MQMQKSHVNTERKTEFFFFFPMQLTQKLLNAN